MRVAAFLSWCGRDPETGKAPALAADIFRQTSGLFHPFRSIPNSDSGKVAEYSLATRLTTHAQSEPWSSLVFKQAEHFLGHPDWHPSFPEDQFHASHSAFTRMSSFASQKAGQDDPLAQGMPLTSGRNPPPGKTGEFDSLWFRPGAFAGHTGSFVEERKIQMSCGIQMLSVPSIPCERLQKDDEKRLCSSQRDNHLQPPLPPAFMIGRQSHVTPAGCQEAAGHHRGEASSSDLHLCSGLKSVRACGRSAGCFDFLEGRRPALEGRTAEMGERCEPMQSDTLATLPSQLATLPSQLATLPSQLATLPSQLATLPSQLATLPSQLDRFPKPAAASFLTRFPKSAPSCLGTSRLRFSRSADRCSLSGKDKDRVKTLGKLRPKRRADANEVSKLRQSGASLRSGSFRHALSLAIRCGDLRKGFSCSQCRYFTDRKNNLKRHIVTMHQESARVLECCGALFPSKASLREHVTMFHRGGYRCQVCARNFCRKALLRRHLTVHSGQKDYACAVCGYATSHKSNLERHQRVHARKPSPGGRGVAGFSRRTDNGNEVNSGRSAHDRKLPRKSRSAKESHEVKAAGTADYENDGESQALASQKLLAPSLDMSAPSSFKTFVNTRESMRKNFAKPHPGVSERPVPVMHDPEDQSGTLTYFRGPFRQFLLPNRLQETHESRDTGLATNPGSCGRSEQLDNTNQTYPETETHSTEDLKENTVPANELECSADKNALLLRKKNILNPSATENKKLSRCDQDNSKKSEMSEWKFREVDTSSENRAICQADKVHASECKKLTPPTRKRMCVLPYHCFSCSLSYSHQAEFQSHPCACLVSSSGLFQFPLSAVVRKGRMPPLPESEQPEQGSPS